MINAHVGRRVGHHTGKETLPKQKFQTPTRVRSKSNKKYRCRKCGKRMPGKTMIECEPDKHGRVFFCLQCYTGSENMTY